MRTIESKRLILRPFTLADAPFLLELLNSPPWLKYIGDRGVRTVADAEEYLRSRIIKSYGEHGFGMFVVILKSMDKPIGSCGLVKRETLPDADLGFAFLPGFEGRGYGFEAATSVLDFTKKTLRKERLLAITLPSNTASVGLLKKLGFIFEKTMLLKGDEEELQLFSIALKD
ncbi:MAG TPA: N-acetyltransferase [Bacteroidetes bacterium]|nr:N-acetyltransferase [Bacteroidota bacterium]